MTKIQRWLLRNIIKDVVRQGDHYQRTTEFFTMFREEWEKEFYEDNIITTNSILISLFEDSLRK